MKKDVHCVDCNIRMADDVFASAHEGRCYACWKRYDARQLLDGRGAAVVCSCCGEGIDPGDFYVDPRNPAMLYCPKCWKTDKWTSSVLSTWAPLEEAAGLDLVRGRSVIDVRSMSAAELRDCGWPPSCHAWCIELEGGVSIIGCDEGATAPCSALLVGHLARGLWRVVAGDRQLRERRVVKP